TDYPTENKRERFNGGERQSVQGASGVHRAKAGSTSHRAKPEPEQSAALRGQLITELENIRSAEEAANWAHRVMGAKNTLAGGDADRVGRASQERLVSITAAAAAASIKEAERSVRGPGRSKKRRTSFVDKSILALPAPRRIRDREHVKSVAKQPCLV